MHSSFVTILQGLHGRNVKQYWPWTQSGSGNLQVQHSASAHIPSMPEHRQPDLRPSQVREEDENQIYASQMEDFLYGQDDSSAPSALLSGILSPQSILARWSV